MFFALLFAHKELLTFYMAREKGFKPYAFSPYKWPILYVFLVLILYFHKCLFMFRESMWSIKPFIYISS